jgi:solute:Na+ symporter, SSS family
VRIQKHDKNQLNKRINNAIMNLSVFDFSVVLLYLVGTLAMGFYFQRKASKNVEAYFLGENTIPWYMLGLSNASGMFDISGTMWTVSILFVYGLKSAWIPWLWPVWNQIFVMVFLAIWMRRSNVITGAEWILTRFGEGRGGRLSHMIVCVFAVLATVGFMAYFFNGIGKFSTSIFTYDLSFGFLGLQVSNEHAYALLIIGITTVYTLVGGMYSVVATEVMQFIIMTLSCLVVGYVAYMSTTGAQIAASVPNGWSDLGFGWNMGLDWSEQLPAVNDKIAADRFDPFGLLFMMMLAKGVVASLAGPVPSYDMQRVLSAKTPAEAAKMSGLTLLVLCAPRYLMVAGFAVLALVHMRPEMLAQGSGVDFERVLPVAIQKFIPIGFQGLLLAGLLAAFMGTFAAFVNAAPAYIVNDFYRKYINPNAPTRTYIRLSYITSILLVVVGVLFGLGSASLNSLTVWITSSLYGGYTAANVLKWLWWRFNGYGYFWGMMGGLLGSTALFFFKEISKNPTPDIYFFPFVFLTALAGCLIGTYATKPDDPEILKSFYSRVRPWSFGWKPIHAQVVQENPNFKGNTHFNRDMMNIVVGIVWQMVMVVGPIYFMIRHNGTAALCLVLFAVTSYWLKRFWWDKLEEETA